MTKSPEEQIQRHLDALRHELRRRILRMLASSGEAISPLEMAIELDEPVTNVSYHTRILVKCEAIILVRTGSVRGATQHFYRPNPNFIETGWVASVLSIEPAAKAT
jgi:DNA-binding transcriptional ArsR family regulator